MAVNTFINVTDFKIFIANNCCSLEISIQRISFFLNVSRASNSALSTVKPVRLGDQYTVNKGISILLFFHRYFPCIKNYAFCILGLKDMSIKLTDNVLAENEQYLNHFPANFPLSVLFLKDHLTLKGC